MRHEGQWWVPDKMSGANKIFKRAGSLHEPIRLCGSRTRTCIQAGGNVGVYPFVLSQSFQRVITFEPDRTNFDCLIANTQTIDKIYPVRGFLANRPGGYELIPAKYAGGHQMGGAGIVPGFTIDGLNLNDVDAIFLDVEGSEHKVLAGAMRTLERWNPLLMLEENKKAHAHGREDGDLLAMVRHLGYRLAYKEAEDIVLTVTKDGS